MKSWLSKAHRSSIGTVAAILCLSATGLSAGIIDLLRGEDEPPDPQRVAFVGAATVRNIQGTAERLTGVERWVALREGDQLSPGDILRTGSGTAILCMRESESFVRLTPNTLCRLVPIQNNWDRAAVSGQEERHGFVVRSCRGQAFAETPTGKLTRLAVNDVLAVGTEVRTEPGAIVDLFHTETGRPVRIRGSVELKLDERTVAQRVAVQPSFAAARR